MPVGDRSYGGRLHDGDSQVLSGAQDDIQQAQQAHDYAWTVLEGILPYSSQVHKQHGQRSQASARSDYDALDELMRQSERAMKELEEALRPTQEEDNIKAATRRRMPGAPAALTVEARSIAAPWPEPRMPTAFARARRGANAWAGLV